MAASLPHPQTLISSIINQLSTIPSTSNNVSNGQSARDRDASASASASALSNLSRGDLHVAKSLFMTLHFLFPHELLPALDLLDRKLVTQLLVLAPDLLPETATPLVPQEPDQPQKSVISEVFYVRSASAITNWASSNSNQTRNFRRAYNPSSPHYEVRLDAWNCTCPAFSFSAFGKALDLKDSTFHPDSVHEDGRDDNSEGESADHAWKFGGTLTRGDSGTPVCKHILAVALGRAAPRLFNGGIKKREVSAKEAAGWGGGWGD